MAACQDDDYLCRLLAAEESSRRAFASYFLRMISGFVLYQDSHTPSLRRIASVSKRWIFDRRRKDLMSFVGICEVFDLSPDVAREKIKTLQREDLLRKAKACYEEPEKKPEEHEPDEPPDDS